MESRDDLLIAIIGLLSACLISVVFLFTLTWLSDIRHPVDAARDVHACTLQTPPAQRS